MDFKTIENRFKPISSWAWNDKLDSSYIKEHFNDILSENFGEVYISAKEGFSSRYMGEEWFRNLNHILSVSKEKGVSVLISDKNGTSAGSGNGIINSLGLEYQQKFLRCEPYSSTNDRTIVCKDGYHFYYDINSSAVDVLKKETAEIFIKEIYSVYKQKSPEINGFISAEPQISYKNIPWSFSLPAAYKDAYGEELLDLLPQLFQPIGDYRNTRIKFWTLVSRLFVENFISPIYEFCKKNNYSYSSSFITDDIYDFTAIGNKMTQFCSMDYPIIKVLSKGNLNPLSTLMAFSVSCQFDKKMPVSQIYTEAAHSATFSDLYQIAGLQFARGTGKISSAFESTSFKGIRKRSMPSWSCLRSDLMESFKIYNNYCARIEKILTSGKAEFNTLLLSNVTSFWSEFDGTENKESEAHYNSILSAIYELERKHIPFHIGDEFLLKEHYYIDATALCIGTQRYTTIVIPENAYLTESTQRILSEFELNGGFITHAAAVKENTVCDNEKVLYTKRIGDGYNINYFYNNSEEEFTSVISAGTKMVNLDTGDIVPFYGVHKFNPFEALVVIDDGTPEISRPFKKPLKNLDISGDWLIEEPYSNVLVLDKCDVYFDNELFDKDINAPDVNIIAHSLNHPVKVDCSYKFIINELCDDIKLVLENESFSLKINETTIEASKDGFYIGKFPTVDISEYLHDGENIITLSTTLTSSTEFEPLYIVGNFSVVTEGNIIKLNNNSYRYMGDFKLSKSLQTCTLSALHKQGFPFFCGELTLKKAFNLSDTQYSIKFNPKGVTAISIIVNGQKVSTILKEPYETDLSDYLQKGNNEIILKISTPMRNLFGPHHYPLGEPATINTEIFYKHKGNSYEENLWESNYNLIEFELINNS